MSTSQKIHLSMAAILQDIAAISKDRKNEQQGFRFRGIDDVYNHLHPIFSAHGVTCIPFVESITQSDGGKTAKGTPITRSLVVMGYRFTADDGSMVEAKTAGEGLDSADKATAKALSAAHKYLIIQTFLVPTVDIEDGDYDPTSNAREELSQQSVETREQGRLEENGQSAEGATPVAPAKRGRKAKVAIANTDQAAQPNASAPQPEPQHENTGAPWKDKHITCINDDDWKGRKLGDLTHDELLMLKESWVEKFPANIAKNPEKQALAKCIIEGYHATIPQT